MKSDRESAFPLCPSCPSKQCLASAFPNFSVMRYWNSCPPCEP
ncbi:hypothetical protein FM101_01405 [Arthrobacter rhombi]|uniref:Uncharacterized protein n=1 Tax=Arthrobacter rhombi TaxID=71253 RepID=A0A1R4EYL5_9MICC|nr:hypothetical protein FM101_01405 [Arthrobacter rhombi]